MGGERGAGAGPRRAVGGAKARGAEAGPIGAARAGRRYCDVTGGRIRRRWPRPSPRPLAPAPPRAGTERDPGAAVAHGPGPGAARRAEAMTEERGRAAAPEGARPHGAPPDGSPRCHPPGPPRAPPDVRFITEERFDFSVLSPADSREEDEEDEESPGGVRWSPLSGAQLEEMVREATRLAAQLQHSHLPPLGPGPSPPGGGGSPRNPRRETFVVKDSPVRELLPTVPPAREDTPGCHPPPAPKGPPARGRGTLARGGPSRLCPPRGAGAAARGRSEPLRKGPAGAGAAPGGAGSGCRAAPPSSRLRPPRKTTASSTLR
ncbi:proline/serine-rich coiled-coil protein 1 isoform X3 [Anas acuta]|uniref:proline/serine-rich coiled-coil protein 1 isoform X3 n=1 Tax=Anas acuta TaxID=28680 RepID=UPI0035C8DB76